MIETYLFIIAPPDSGSTFLQNQLALCQNVISFQSGKHKHGIEGGGLVWETKHDNSIYPRDTQHGVVKMFSEKREIWEKSDKFRWDQIKNIWNKQWERHPNFKTAQSKVFLEKTPSNIYTIDQLNEHFKPGKFIILNRNPYATIEGIMRTCKEKKKIVYKAARCAKHWVACAKKQRENLKKYSESALKISYEDICDKPVETAQEIMNFAQVTGLNFQNNVRCHSMDNKMLAPVINYNQRHINNLSEEQITEINNVLSNDIDIIKFWGYKLL